MKTARFMTNRLTPFFLLLVFVLFTGTMTATAQDTPSLKEAVEGDAAAQKIIDDSLEKMSRDPLNRTTPRSMIIGLAQLMKQGKYEKAVEYLDMRYLPETIKPEDGPRLARQLQFIYSRNIWLDIVTISNNHEGHLDDGLPKYRDLLGRVETRKGFVDLYAQRVPDGKGDFIWKISNATVAMLPELWEEFGYSDFEIMMGELLPHFRFMNMENWQLVFLLTFCILAWPVITMMINLLNKLTKKRTKVHTEVLIHFLRGPARVFLYIVAILIFIRTLNLSLKAKVIFESSVWGYVACIWLILGLVDLVNAYYRTKLHSTEREYAVVLIRPISIAVKILLVLVLLLLGLDNAGYDMTTIIAGLGVGSIAVALAAQKTLENVFGAFTLYIARPVKPGDFCRFGTTIGTVEDMGLRSIEIRTLDRTLVSIPNAIFSSGEVENFSARDRFRYLRTVRLRLDTGTDQLRYLLVELRKMLYAHPMTRNDLVRARFTDVDAYSIALRVETHIKTDNFSIFLEVAEDLNLRLVDIVREAGTGFSLPSQTLKIEPGEESAGQRRAEIEAIVEQWRKEDQLPFPELSNEEIEALEDSLDYPPKGSPQAEKA